MSFIINASLETQTVRVFGNYFTLKPGQIKNFQEQIAHFLATDRRYHGFVALPDSFEDPSFAASEEGAKVLAEAKAAGIAARVAYLKRVVNNELISLKQDLERDNDKSDPRSYMSEGVLAAMRELVKYQDLGEDVIKKKIDEAKELEEKIKSTMR